MSETPLRDRKKAVNRARVLEVAHQLFHEQGFDGTTIEQICGESLISKRTFFRYFKDKESLIFPNREERLGLFVSFLADNQLGQNPFDILRDATRLFGGEFNKNKTHLRNQQSLIRASSALLAREREIDLDWQRAIAGAFSARSGETPASDLWAKVLASAIMGVVRATTNFWFEHQCEDDITELGLKAIDYLEMGFPKNIQ
jgi:AcrR family transcriptional regulator